MSQSKGSDTDCIDTAGNDHLVGSDDKRDDMLGREGDDLYDGKGGSDVWHGISAASDDTYLIPSTEFSQLLTGGFLSIQDDGGSLDVLDAGAYKSTDFALSKKAIDDGLFMDGLGKRDILIPGFFAQNSIDLFKFSDGTFTAEQIKSKVP